MQTKWSKSLLVFAPVLMLSPERLRSQEIKPADPMPVERILERLERLEQQNRELLSEVRALREQVMAARASLPQGAAAQPGGVEDIQDRLAVQESRVAELAQSKVESDHQGPVRLTGMLLFNAFTNGRYSGGADYPTSASQQSAGVNDGASLRQSVVGLKFDGPSIAGGGKVTGAVYMDFFAGSNQALNQLVRLRLATVDLAWKNTTITVGQDKPILAPREPNSLAQVGVSPATNAGNLWLWQPQARIEQRFSIANGAGVRAQFGVYQTSEGSTQYAAEYRNTLARARPGYEGRVEFWKRFGESARIEIAPGFHESSTHVAGISVPSDAFSMDWLIRPAARFDFSGAFFKGENVAVMGALRQGVTIFSNERIQPVRSVGGWAQASLRATERLTFNLYGGQQDDRNSDLLPGGVGKNQIYAGNIMYRLGPNVLASFETSQTRTSYIGAGTRLNLHYDVALAYLF